MRIVRIVTRMNIGGPSLHVAILSNQLDSKRFSTCLMVGQTETGEGSRLPWVENGPARIVKIRSLGRRLNPWKDLCAFFQILQALRQEQPAVIHTHMAKAGTLGRLAGIIHNRFGPGRKPGRRAVLVHTFHGHVLEGYFSRGVSRIFASVERWMEKRTDCLIAVSETIRDSLMARGIGSAEQWRVIRLGVDFSELKKLPDPNSSSPLRCGLVGRLVPIKNPELFLQALEILSRTDPGQPVQGRIIGDGPLRQDLEERARQKGLSKTVSFLGWQKDAQSCYGDLDVVCVTSWNEGTPLSLIEAMAAGRTVVSTAVGGVTDLLGPQEGSQILPGHFGVAARGLLIQDGDGEGLAAALAVLARDPSLRRRLAESGRRYVLEQYSHTRLLQDVSELYEQLTTNSSKRAS